MLVFKNQWSGNHLDFRASLLRQNATGTVDVAEDHVRLEVQLPWLLSMLVNKAKALVEKQGKRAFLSLAYVAGAPIRPEELANPQAP